MRTLDEVIADRSPESQARIKKMTDDMVLEVGVQMMCEEPPVILPGSVSNMNKFIRFLFILFYLVCISLIYLASVDKYDVIYDLDSTLPQGSLNNSSDNGKVFAGLLLFFIFISQMVFFYYEKSRSWRWITSVMTIAAFLFYCIR